MTRRLDRLERDVGELLERREPATGGESLAVYRDDPVGFLREVLNAEPWRRQVDVAEAVHDEPLVAVRSCNGAGKDWLAARLALWWVYAREGLVVLTGPTEAQVEEILMRGEVREAFAGAPELPGELHVRALRPVGEGRAGILAKTASGVSALTGFHEERVLFVLTEAQGVDDLAFDAAFAVATGEEDRILALGNPLDPSGRFYRASRPDSEWRALRIPAAEVPNVHEGRVVVPGLMTRQGVQRIAAEYGETSGYYRARVEAEFPDEPGDALFRRAWLDAAADRHEEAAEPSEKAPLRFALDPARHGPDASVLGVRRGSCLEEIRVWEGRLDTMELTGRVREALAGYGVSSSTALPYRIVVDEVGLGAGVLDRLREDGFEAAGFNGGRQALEESRYFNRRAEAFWTLRRKLEEGRIALPDDERLFEELLATTWRPTGSGLVQIEAKRDLTSRIGRSPDRADAVSMAFVPLAGENGRQVAARWPSQGEARGSGGEEGGGVPASWGRSHGSSGLPPIHETRKGLSDL